MKKPRNIVYGVDDIPSLRAAHADDAGGPSNEEIIAATEGQYRLAGYMLRNLADRVQVSNRGRRTTVAFHFDH